MKFKHLIRNLLILFIFLIVLFAIYSYFNQNLDKSTNTNNTNKDLNSEYKIYFCPENDCNTILFETLNNAKTIDCAVYDISLDWIYNTIKDKNIRVITDNDQITNYAKQFDFIKTDKTADYMHNKFCILDSNLLLIGSLNFTADAILKQNNNFILTDNNNLINSAKDYFNILWNNNFSTGINQDNFCASPSNCMNNYIQETKNAKYSIKCMFFSFTYDALGKELINAKNKGLDVKLILEKSQDSQYSEYQKLKDNNINVIWDKNPSYMHNKFCVFDSQTLITGSMNPSNNGNFNNNESIIIINNSEVAKQYENYFNKYFSMWQ